ncbi:MAG TPA: Na+/H+ antiporter [Candidatus Limnocylindrales bacterium]|nr:Na+/H+ antiporter [Candidatus Limnocylindrales bacterium]
MRSVQIILLLVGLATVVAVFARRLAVPAPSLLVVAGLIIGFVPGVPQIHVTPETISLIVLPPLLYAAGEELSWPELRRQWKPVAALAIGLVPVSAAAVALVTMAVTPVPWVLAFVLGAVLSATDPVAVTALGRKLALPQRLHTLVQAESLFNDATSLILFRVSATIAVSATAMTGPRVAGEFALLALGGAVCGAAVAGVVALLRLKTEEPVVESVITLVTPYFAFVLAEAFGASGITAVVVASVILGALASRLTTPAIRLQIHAVHATVVFGLESVVFALIGLQLPGLLRTQAAADQPWVIPMLLITATMIAVRIAWVFPLAGFRHWRHVGADRPMWQVPAVVSWAGARGVVPLAAALSIPEGVAYHDLLVLLAVGVTCISLVVQGFTLSPLVRRVSLAVPHEDMAQEYRVVWSRLIAVGQEHLDKLEDLQALAPVLIERARQSLRGRDHVDEGEHITSAYASLRRDMVRLQTRELEVLSRGGEVTEATRRRVQRDLDLDAERFNDGGHH